MIVVLGIESIESIESIYYCVALLSGVSQEEYLQFYKGWFIIVTIYYIPYSKIKNIDINAKQEIVVDINWLSNVYAPGSSS